LVLFPMNQRAEDLMMGAPVGRLAEAAARAAHPGGEAGLKTSPQSLAQIAILFAARAPSSLYCPLHSGRRGSPVGGFMEATTSPGPA